MSVTDAESWYSIFHEIVYMKANKVSSAAQMSPILNLFWQFLAHITVDCLWLVVAVGQHELRLQSIRRELTGFTVLRQVILLG